MHSPPLLYADFHNADAQGRVRLNSIGTVSDLSRQQVQLREQLKVELYSDDADETGRPQRLCAHGIVTYSAEEQCWTAIIDWQRLEAKPALDSAADAGSPSPQVSPADGDTLTMPPAGTSSAR